MCACVKSPTSPFRNMAAAPDFAGAAAALGDDPAARGRLQQLEDEQKQLQLAKKRLVKDIANEQRKRARLLEKARHLSDADLAAIIGERAAIAAKAKAKAKGKAKAKAKAAPAAGVAAAAVEEEEEAVEEEEEAAGEEAAAPVAD